MQSVGTVRFESTAALAAAAVPTLLEESPWPLPSAFMSWHPDAIMRATPMLSPVRRLHREPALFWNPEEALEYNPRHCVNASRGSDWHGMVHDRRLTMSVDDFFAPPPNVSHFYTTSLLHHATGEPHPSIGPFTPLSGIAASGEAPMLKMWMGTSGAVTPLHLDSQHNFYAQLHGEKTFRLYPPHAAHEALYLHPLLHPLCHLSLPRAATPDEAARDELYPPYDAAGAPAGLVVRLQPGAVLYMPPWWGHHATCERSCVGANAWFPSQPGAAMDAVRALPVPFEAEWGAPLRRAAALLFLRRVLHHAARPPTQSPAGLVALLLDTRWRRGEELLAPAERTACEPPHALTGLLGKIEDYASNRAAHLRRVDEPVRSIVLHDQLEQIAHWADGAAHRTHALLRSLRVCCEADEAAVGEQQAEAAGTSTSRAGSCEANDA